MRDKKEEEKEEEEEEEAEEGGKAFVKNLTIDAPFLLLIVFRRKKRFYKEGVERGPD